MKRLFTLLTIALMGVGTIQAQWQRLHLYAGHEDDNFNVYSNYFNYYDVCCITENTVYACGDSGIILKSTNGGNGWKLKHFDETETITALGFANKRIGYAGGYKTVGGSQHNILFKTGDYGNTWEEIPTTIDFSFEIENTGSERKFVILSPDTLFVYNKMNVFRSIDGGQSFNISYDYEEEGFNYYFDPEGIFDQIGVLGVYFEGMSGYIVNYANETDTTGVIWIKKTLDCGETWENIAEISFVTDYELYYNTETMVIFTDMNHVRIILTNNIFETSDGFETITQLRRDFRSIGGPFDWKFNSSDFGCCITNITMDCWDCDRISGAFVTTDGGLSWHDKLQDGDFPSGKYSYYRYMFAVDGIDSVFYVVSEDGAGYRYGTPHQEEESTFASQGSEWYFNLSSFMGSPISYYKMEVLGDTVVQGHTCSIITPSYLGGNGGNQYVYEENKVVYWYNATTDSFTTLYDFNANEGDSWICDIDSCSYQVTVTSIDSVTWEGHTYRVQNVTSESPLQIMYGKIIDGIGYEGGLFPYMWACDDVVYDGNYPNYLRCYFKDGEMLYHEGSYYCDEKQKTDRWVFPLVFTDATNNPDTVWFVQYDSTMVTLNAILEEEGINPNVDTTNFCVYFEDGLGNKTKISAKPFGTNFEEVKIDSKNVEFPIRTNWDRNIVNSPCEPYGAIQFSQITGEYFGMYDIDGYQYDDLYDLWDNIFQNADSTGLQPAVVYNNEIGYEEEWVLNNYFPMYITITRKHFHSGNIHGLTASTNGHNVILNWNYGGCEHIDRFEVYRATLGGTFLSLHTTTETHFEEENVPAGQYEYMIDGYFTDGSHIYDPILYNPYPSVTVEVQDDTVPYTFAPAGAEWYFGLSSFMGGPMSYYKMEVLGDTVVQGHNCSIITAPYIGGNGGNQYVYEENNVVYWYNVTTDAFTILYNFNANAGDSWTCDIDSCSYQVTVTSIDSVTWEGHTYRVQNVTSESPLQIMYGKIIDGIGYEEGLFPYMWACDDVVHDGEYPNYLRCYFKDGEMLYHGGEYDCDEMTYCWDGSVAENYAGGDGTAENPYKISTERQLALLAQQTNDGTGGDAYYELTNNLSLGICGNELYKWTPIGNTEVFYDGGEIDTVFRYFTGHFDGKGHSIINMVQTIESGSYQLTGGLFGCTKGAEIKNLLLINGSVSGSGKYVGGLVGHAGNTNIIGCSVYEVSVSTDNAPLGDIICAGGLVGYAGVPLGTSEASSDTCRIENCRTDIPSTVEGVSFTGGIVGSINNKNGDTRLQTPYKILNCTVGADYYTNYFTVKGQQTTGGIAGFAVNAIISGCKNFYKVEGGLNGAPYDWGVAGILGEISYPSSIENCINYGSVSGTRFVGGIVGISQHVYDILVTNCTNNGEVTASHNGGVYAGGIVGKGYHLSLNRCANKGNVKATTGIAYVSVGGLVAEGGTVVNSYNLGNVTAQVETFDEDFEGIYAGGISGVGIPCNVYNTGIINIPEIPEDVMVSTEPIIECGSIVGFTGSKRFNCYWLNNSDLPACGNTNYPNIPGSSSFHAGETSTSWVLNDAQYGTTDLLEALNSGALTVLDSMPQFPLLCLWEEDVNLTNNGYPVFGGEIVYDTASHPMAGKEWYYELQNPNGSITYQHLYYLADTTIREKDIEIIVRTNTLYDKGSVTTHEYIYEEDGKVYWWNAAIDDFTTLYDFSANVGDEWEIKVGTESITMHVDAVGETEYNGKTFKTLQVSDAENLFSGIIVASVGHLTSFFPEKLMRKSDEGSVEGLRCLWNDGTLVFKYGDKDCDEVYEQLHYGLGETTTNSFSLYPNPTDGVLIVETQNFASPQKQTTYRITNLMGQTLLQGRLNSGSTSLDVSGLGKGMYFLTIEGSSKKFIVVF